MIKIPVQNVPSQIFNLNIDDEEKLYEFEIIYIARGDYYTLSLKDLTNNTELVKGIKLVSGTALFSAFNFMSGDLFVINSAEYNDDPQKDTWATLCELFYFNKNELDSL